MHVLDWNSSLSNIARLAAELAGLALTGREVQVVFQKPMSGARGMVFRKGEKAVIFIDRNLQEEQVFRTLLHELSHVSRHFHLVETYKGKPSGSLSDVPVERLMPEVHEVEAESLSFRWYETAVKLSPEGNFILWCLALTKEYLGGKKWKT